MEKDRKFVNELFGLGGNSSVYRPPPRESSDNINDTSNSSGNQESEGGDNGKQSYAMLQQPDTYRTAGASD